jgi:serine/threonine protein kinase
MENPTSTPVKSSPITIQVDVALAQPVTDRPVLASEKFLRDSGLPELIFENYTFVSHIADGGWGSCFKFRQSDGGPDDGKFVAMKFFGMLGCSKPMPQMIEEEIKTDWDLNRLQSVPKLLGYIVDSFEGYAHVYHRERKDLVSRPPHIVSGKKFKGRYLVKVSECLEKDIMNTLITEQIQFGQRAASTVFRNLIISLKEIHDAGIVHKDLKPENFIFSTHIDRTTNLAALGAQDFKIKLIDFGCCAFLSTGQSEIRNSTQRIDGTPMYYAPETLLHQVHSKATDIWQAGVCLWILLFQKYPFESDSHTRRYKDGSLKFPEKTSFKIPDNCRDLFHKIFSVDPRMRPTCDDILKHSWIRDRASLPNDDFGEEYRNAIKDWILRQKLKETIDRGVVKCDEIKTQFLDAIAAKSMPNFQISTSQYRSLQKSFLRAIGFDPNSSTPDNHEGLSVRGGIDFENFRRILLENGIDVFATEEAFRFFDIDGGGTVDYFEFLSVLAPFREDAHESERVVDRTCRFYFEMFDYNASEGISREEFRAAITQILLDFKDEGYSCEDVDAVFNTIDINCDGDLSYPEFRAWFYQLTRSVSVHRSASLGRSMSSRRITGAGPTIVDAIAAVSEIAIDDSDVDEASQVLASMLLGNKKSTIESSVGDGETSSIPASSLFEKMKI